jgi:hypothetical protein
VLVGVVLLIIRRFLCFRDPFVPALSGNCFLDRVSCWVAFFDGLEQLEDVLEIVLLVCQEALERNDRDWGGRFEPLVEQALYSEGLTKDNASLRTHLCAFFSMVGDRKKNRHLLDEHQFLNPHCIWFETPPHGISATRSQ